MSSLIDVFDVEYGQELDFGWVALKLVQSLADGVLGLVPYLDRSWPTGVGKDDESRSDRNIS